MVAPTRTPQARGVKCDLCKKILALATWLDQTKPAKEVKEAEQVLTLIDKHNLTECPCIPKNIENLLVGSTYFEAHRIQARTLDARVHKKQVESISASRQQVLARKNKSKSEHINDCVDHNYASRFKIFTSMDQDDCRSTRKMLSNLKDAIKFWKIAFEDQTNPFNSKLALRLGLTHHVIYACYRFKYHKMLDCQLLTANLLVNIFESVEGVTLNAIIHAYFLLVRTLIDCDQFQLARQYLKYAKSLHNQSDETHYEWILLTSVECELSLLTGRHAQNQLDELLKLAVIKPDDKLQHYYARTLALGVVIKYINMCCSRSDQCFEFYCEYRYLCAIIRRCYESSFELILYEKDSSDQNQKKFKNLPEQILDHSWIGFAVCDFVFSNFNLLSDFFMRSGQPEVLELLYNGLNLVAHRTGSHYWQAKLAIIGSDFDILCDKYDHCYQKLCQASESISHSEFRYLKHSICLEIEAEFDLIDSNIAIYSGKRESVINSGLIQCKCHDTNGHSDSIPTKDSISNHDMTHLDEDNPANDSEPPGDTFQLLHKLRNCRLYLENSLNLVHLYDPKNASTLQMQALPDQCINFTSHYGMTRLALKMVKCLTLLKLFAQDTLSAEHLISTLKHSMESSKHKTLDFSETHMILEILLYHFGIDKSEKLMIDAINSSNVFLVAEDSLIRIDTQLSSLTLGSEVDSKVYSTKKKTRAKTKLSKLGLSSRSRRRIYNVTNGSEPNLDSEVSIKVTDAGELIKSFPSISIEDITTCYLRCSEPSPDYLLYRHVHEILFSLRLRDDVTNYEKLLYHFSESTTSNTMRYRWMMSNEQQSKLMDANEVITQNSIMNKLLGFSNSNHKTQTKSLIKLIPLDYKLVQLKYLIDSDTQYEHILLVSFDRDGDLIFVNARRSSSCDFLDTNKLNNGEAPLSYIPDRISAKIEAAKKALFFKNHKLRTEARQRIETDLELLLYSMENDWLRSYRFLICGKTLDPNYTKFVDLMTEEIKNMMSSNSCLSESTLRNLIENAPLLSREEFCSVLSSLFSCLSRSDEVCNCYNRWTKSVENFISSEKPGLNKSTYIQTISRGQVGIILDKHLEHIPIESLPIVSIAKQGLFRLPSLRLFALFAHRAQHLPIRVKPTETSYILDPSSNLAKTRERFEGKLRARKTWVGYINQPPKTDHLEEMLATRQVYLFIGHGAGTTYYNKLCKNRGLIAMPNIMTMPIVMGCSSGKVQAEGPKLESFGINWVFIIRGSPAYIGLLWDVTDTDIDKFLDSFLSEWMESQWDPNRSIDKKKDISSTEAVARARQVCQYKYLVGSTPVTYGLPIHCKTLV